MTEQKFNSLIDWLAKSNKSKAVVQDALAYDHDKTRRLEELNLLLGLPINRTDFIYGSDFDINSPKAKKIISERRGDRRKFAFRIAPRSGFASTFEVIKKYGVNFSQFAKYFKNLKIDKTKAVIRITDSRAPLKFSSVFVSGKQGVVGEFCTGSLYQLTYGATDGSGLRSVFYNRPGQILKIIGPKSHIKPLKAMLGKIGVVKGKERILKHKGYLVANGYLSGYFEYVKGAGGEAFTDINQKKITNNLDISDSISLVSTSKGLNVGQGIVAGKFKGKIIGIGKVFGKSKGWSKKDILICETLTLEHLKILKKVGAVITENGGLMSHPAIVARELGVPYLAGVKDAIKLFAGKKVEVDFGVGGVVVM